MDAARSLIMLLNAEVKERKVVALPSPVSVSNINLVLMVYFVAKWINTSVEEEAQRWHVFNLLV